MKIHEHPDYPLWQKEIDRLRAEGHESSAEWHERQIRITLESWERPATYKVQLDRSKPKSQLSPAAIANIEKSPRFVSWEHPPDDEVTAYTRQRVEDGLTRQGLVWNDLPRKRNPKSNSPYFVGPGCKAQHDGAGAFPGKAIRRQRDGACVECSISPATLPAHLTEEYPMMEPKANRQSRIKRDQLSLEKYLPLEERKRRAQARSLKRKEYQTKRVRKAAEALNSMTEYQVRCLYRWYWFADDIQEGKHGYSAVTRDVCDGLGYYVLQSGELYIDQNEKWFSKQSKRPGERPPRNPNIAWQTRKIGAKPPKAWDEEIQRLLDEYDVVPLKDITGPPPSYPHNLLAGERVVAKSDRAQPTN